MSKDKIFPFLLAGFILCVPFALIVTVCYSAYDAQCKQSVLDKAIALEHAQKEHPPAEARDDREVGYNEYSSLSDNVGKFEELDSAIATAYKDNKITKDEFKELNELQTRLIVADNFDWVKNKLKLSITEKSKKKKAEKE